MLHLGLDSDAFHFSRSLGLLGDLGALAGPATKLGLHLTGFVARHELNDLATVITQLEAAKVLTVWPIKTKSPTYELFRELIEDFDKGESELCAWVAKAAPAGTTVVSCDKEVPKLAKQLKIRSVDLAQLVVILVNGS